MTFQPDVEWFAGRHMTPARERMASILQRVSEATGVSPVQILGEQRIRPVVAARHEFIGWAYQAGFNYAEIGRFLGRDQSTIGYALGRKK